MAEIDIEAVLPRHVAAEALYAADQAEDIELRRMQLVRQPVDVVDHLLGEPRQIAGGPVAG